MKNRNEVKIIIATHKKYRMPKDKMYLPLQVGAACNVDESGNLLNIGYNKDNVGENISKLNGSFCELTGLYWAWKNLDADYIGLAHYRRHFSMIRKMDKWDSILTYEQLKPYLGKVRVFTPSKRRYFIESLYSHYAHTHYASQLDMTRRIIRKKYPEYIPSYDKVVNHTYGYMFNMMILDKTLLDEYCSWLFDILFSLQHKIEERGLSAFQKRCYGRISEIIFNVWLDKKLSSGEISKNQVKEIPYIHMEKINWCKKGKAFLMAKLFHKKYESSF